MSSYVGALLLCVGCTWIGIAAVGRLQRRAQTLQLFVSAITYLQSEIQFCLRPLPDIMHKLTQQYPTLAPVFKACETPITNESAFADTWGAALMNASLPLTADDLRILQDLGGSLGQFDARGQSSAICQTLAQLTDACKQANNAKTEKSKLFGFLGVATGVIVTILLI